jgi:5'/3'-nucleotidase SurE
MRILITNDDGVYSPGIAALAEVASAFGDVRIVAPDVEMSSAGHAITASRPLTYKRTPLHGLEAYRVNGTPADCVALGTHNWDKVDVVLSGINLGSNLGNGMWHSGTLAAAKQAVLLGCRGIALSAPVAAQGEPEFELLKPAVREVLERLLPADLNLVNVNFPETRQHLDAFELATGDPGFIADRIERILENAATGSADRAAMATGATVGTTGTGTTEGEQAIQQDHAVQGTGASATGMVTLSQSQMEDIRRHLEMLRRR